MTDAADVKKARMQQLQGQESEEAGTLVHAQRELKKMAKLQRKIEAQIKAAEKEGKDVAQLKLELAAAVAQTKEFEAVLSAVPVAESSSAASNPAKAPDSIEKTLVNPMTLAGGGEVVKQSDDRAAKLARARQLEEELQRIRSELGEDPGKPCMPLVGTSPAQHLASSGVASSSAPGGLLVSRAAPPPRIQLDLLTLASERPVPPTPLPTPAHSDAMSDMSKKHRKRGSSHVVNVFGPRDDDHAAAAPFAGCGTPSADLSAAQSSAAPVLAQQNHDAKLPPAVPSYAYVFPRIAELGLLCQTMQIVGANARTVALIDALIDMSNEMPLLNTGSFTQHVCQQYLSAIDQNCKFLNACREHCYGQLYVIRKLRLRVTRNLTCGVLCDSANGETPPMIDTPSVSSPLSQRAPAAFNSRGGMLSSPSPSGGGVSAEGLQPLATGDSTPIPEVFNVRDAVVKELVDIREELYRAIHCIVEERSPAVFHTRDIVLVCGRSSTIEQVLLRAASRVPAMQRTPFHVIIVDCAPLFEGRDFAWRLQQAGVAVTYDLLSSISVLMPRCTKVFIGASAVLQSGEVQGRCGTALVAATAKRFRKPVICFTESYKFISKVWIGSLIRNQDADSALRRQLFDSSPASDSSSSCTVLVRKPVPAVANAVHGRGYLYDLCPAEFIDMIVSEMGCLHPSAIAAAIRDREDREKDLA